MEGNEDAKGEVIPTKELVTSDNVQSTPDLVPARMLNEYAYCPRLAYLEWVQGEFADSVDTIEGRFQHRRVDRPSGKLPSRPTGAAAEPAEEDDDAHETIHARSVMLSDNAVGAIARIDLIEGKGNVVTPVDYKHGKAPDVPEGAWEPERVQVCIQGLLLRANGYICTKGILYFVESRQRVTVPFDDALITRTLELLSGIRGMASSGQIPQPLVDSPKCPRCSLVGICLPDEVNLLSPEVQAVGRDDVRRYRPWRRDGLWSRRPVAQRAMRPDAPFGLPLLRGRQPYDYPLCLLSAGQRSVVPLPAAAHARTSPATYSSEGSEAAELSAGRIPNSTSSAR